MATKNRIGEMEGKSDKDDAVEKRPPTARALRSWHWRCPDAKCGHLQLSKKSTSHESTCNVCGRSAYVAISGA